MDRYAAQMQPGAIAGGEPFNNTDLINAFVQSFVSFAISLDPNAKVDPSNITPQWELYGPSGGQVVFNKTVDEKPDVHPAAVDDELLRRCKWVYFCILY